MKAIDILVEYDALVKTLTARGVADPQTEALKFQREKYRVLDTETVELQ